jgi:hypothetical protein
MDWRTSYYEFVCPSRDGRALNMDIAAPEIGALHTSFNTQTSDVLENVFNEF